MPASCATLSRSPCPLTLRACTGVGSSRPRVFSISKVSEGGRLADLGSFFHPDSCVLRSLGYFPRYWPKRCTGVRLGEAGTGGVCQ